MKYFVYQTNLQNRRKYLGRLLLTGTCDQATLIDRMLQMGTSLSKPDITAVLMLLAQAVGRVCAEGYRVTLEGLVQITPSLTGTFEGRNDTFQSPRNQFVLTARADKCLTAALDKALLDKLVADERRPVLAQVTDSEGEPGDPLLTAGHIVSITGCRLRFDPRCPGESLRLVNAAESKDWLPVTSFFHRKNRELVFRLPTPTFSKGYFELASFLGSTSLRVGRSVPLGIRHP
jgi:hypothetical protein